MCCISQYSSTPEIWGIHGLQRMKTDESTVMPRLDQKTLNGLLDADRWLGYQQLRHNAEFKAGSIAIHWRGMSEEDAEDLRARVLLGWRSIAEYSGLDLLDFDGGIEIRASLADKGDAVRTFLSEISPDTRRLFWAMTSPTNPLFGPCRGAASACWFAPGGGRPRRSSG